MDKEFQSSHFANVNGTRLHYRIIGSGSPVVLLHGYTQTGHMWNPLISELKNDHTFIVPDLRGAGDSEKPASGYDKKNMAYGKVPEALVKNRERIYFEHFWNDFAANPTQSISEIDRQIYAAAYAQENGMHAGFEYFKNFEQDAKDFSVFATHKVKMPFLVLTGEKASWNFLIEQVKQVATHVQGKIIPNSGHWLLEEAPLQTMLAIRKFIT